ncbi:DUF397 domain-containing protein [Streptomyces coeruleorubidus]|uniref:DUF397 domain-containing protein n=1 Tax=Streptomyces coeruleorubidus TaxID=116188 RepID=A0ABZ0KFP7_STRC4|nr:DUF397 domain-containing protein [Streptomyces coeruleorubidus]WOT36617.1 DUF397 domain-containing protein [Streptomyces coeruleorubidus]
MSASPLTHSEPRWFKSSYSGGNTTECLECANVAHGALIRDSKYGQRGPIVSVGSEAWGRFIGALSSANSTPSGATGMTWYGCSLLDGLDV